MKTESTKNIDVLSFSEKVSSMKTEYYIMLSNSGTGGE